MAGNTGEVRQHVGRKYVKVGKLYKYQGNVARLQKSHWSKPCVYLGPAPLIREDGVVVPNHKFLVSDGVRIVDQSLLRTMFEVEQ